MPDWAGVSETFSRRSLSSPHRPGSTVVSYAVNLDTQPGNAAEARYSVTCDGTEVFAATTEDSVFQWLRQDIDTTVSQRSRQMLFVHAGVVGWRGLAIIIPGRSHSGKSTLVAELVRRGAVYYSDEFAVLDETGRVHPYKRSPVLRDQARKPQDLRLLREDEPTEPLSIGLIVAGHYQPGATWRPAIVAAPRLSCRSSMGRCSRVKNRQGPCESLRASRPRWSRSGDCDRKRRTSRLNSSISWTMRS